jgi:hypothetical protein
MRVFMFAALALTALAEDRARPRVEAARALLGQPPARLQSAYPGVPCCPGLCILIAFWTSN